MNNKAGVGRHVGIGVLASLVLVCPTPVQSAQRSGAKSTVLLFYGVYTQHYQLNKALADYDVKVSDAHSKGVKHFPTPAKLAQTSVVILSDVGGGEFTQSQVEQITAYVKRGGSVLVLGGPFTLGLGKFAENGLGEMLPVGLEPFDLKWEKRGVPLRKTAEHPALKGVDLSKKPMAYWIHRVRPRKGSQVILNAGDYPCLIAGCYGKGKVMVFTGTPMGIAAQGGAGKGRVPFWKWDGWTGLVRSVADWLTKEGR